MTPQTLVTILLACTLSIFPDTLWASSGLEFDPGLFTILLIAGLALACGFLLSRHFFGDKTEILLKKLGVQEHETDLARKDLDRTRAELDRAKKKLEDVLSNAVQGFFKISPTGEVLEANKAAAAMLGYNSSPELLAALSTGSYTLSMPKKRIEEITKPLVMGRCLRDYEVQLETRDGEQRWFLFDAKPTCAQDGKVLFVEGMFQDITERKNAEEALIKSEEKFAGILDNMNIGFYRTTTDIKGKFLQANTALALILGFDSAHELMSACSMDFYPSLENRENFLTNVVAQGIVEEYEHKLIKKDGAEIWVSETATVQMDQDMDTKWVDGLVVDITERHNMAKVLKAKTMSGKDCKEDFMQSRMLMDISHKIRTSLTTVMGMNELLLDTPLTPEQKKYLHVCRQSNDSLLNMLEEGMDSAGLESDKVSIIETVFSPRELVESVCTEMSERLGMGPVEIICSVDPKTPANLEGNSMGIRQILLNLMSNAIRHTKKGEVVAHVGPAETGELTASDVPLAFTVRDTGLGIAEDKLEKLFNPSSNAPQDMTRTSSQTGLGLILCKQFIDRMGGEIFVESEPGLGSFFSFTVKLKKASDPGFTIFEKNADLKNTSILIVDNNKSAREMLKQTLAYLGADTRMAKSAAVAAELVRGGFDIVLMDQDMPSVTGTEAVERMKMAGDDVDNVILMAHLSQFEDMKQNAEKLGIADVISKPVTYSQLLQATTSLIKTIRAKESGTPVPGPEQEKAFKILVVEDTKDNRLLLDYYFKSTPHTIEFAENGMEAIALFKINDFDLVLMDIQMPVMDGHEATKVIRDYETSKQLPPVPIIALTAHANEQNKKMCAEAGCSGFIVKPVNKKTLTETLKRFTIN